jgi:hypothetical protein
VVISAPADPSGKLSPLAIQTEKETLAVLKNAVFQKKMQPHVGKKSTLTGVIKEMHRKKVMEVWVFQRMEWTGS